MSLTIADISEFQGDVDWAAYGGQNSAVIVRAHNGWRADFKWAQNLAGARARCQWRAFYQYLPASVDPAAAARAFAATVGVLLSGEVMILDLEEGDGDQRGRLNTWLDTLQAPTEWTYTGLGFARAHLVGVGVDWIAAYGQAEMTEPHRLWQYTNARFFAGIGQACDASVFHGTLADLAGLSGGPVSPAAPIRPIPTPTGGLTVNTIDLRTADKTAVRAPGVVPLQRLLGIIPDGIAGPHSKWALGEQQRIHGVTQDFIFGPATATALLAK